MIRLRLPEHPARLTDPPNPIVTVLLVYAAASGAAYLVGLSTSRSIDLTLAPASRVVWAVLVAGGAAAALAGQWWLGRPFSGARLKRAGLVAAALGMVVYGVAVLGINGTDGVQAGLANLGFGTAFLLRARQVGSWLRAKQQEAAKLHQKERGTAGGTTWTPRS